MSETTIMKTVEEVPEVQDPMSRLQLATVYLASMLNGFNDGSLGAILPYMERDYGVGYTVVSLIFIGQGIGSLFAAIFLDDLYPGLGQVDVFRIANIAVTLGYIPMVVAAPFPLITIAFSLVGFGTAINRTLGKTLCSNSPNKPLLSEILYGCHGIGAIFSSLVATAMVTTEGTPWNRFYIISVGVAVSVLLLSSLSSRSYEKKPNIHPRDLETTSVGLTIGDIPQTLCARTVLLGATLTLAYRGIEGSISGWTVTLLLDTTLGNPRLFGCVLTGFWAGITVGRLSSFDMGKRLGQNPLVYGSIILAAAFQLLIWLMSDVNNAVMAAFAAGTMLGPVYPHVAAIFVRPMVGKDSSKEIMTITTIGSLGAAMASFLTGLLAQVAGTCVLHIVVLVLLFTMLVCWWGIPEKDKACRTSP